MPKRLYTIKDASRILKVNEALVRHLIKEKKLKAIKIGRSFRISEKGLTLLLNVKKVTALYTLEEASKILKINKLTLYNLTKKKLIKTIKIGRFFRISGKAAFDCSLKQKFFTIEEVAKIFKVNHTSIRKLLAKKKLRAIKLGTLYRIPEKEILAFTDQKKIKPLLDIKELQEKLKLSRLTILKLIASKKLAAFKVGKLYRLTEEAITAYKKSQKETYTVQKLARELKVSASLIRKMIKRNEIRAKKVGREYLIESKEIKKLLK